MLGLELSRSFFSEIVLPVLECSVPDLVSLIAVGLPGGSQCHGHDDKVSRDHGWGPAFAVWLPEQAPASIADRLRSVLSDLPSEFRGYRTSVSRELITLNQYLRSVIGITEAPACPVDWLRVPEEYLFEVVHRPLLLDRSGFAAARFAQFSTYPEDVWRKRLAAALLWLWEWGPKHLKRAEARADECAALMYWIRFSESAAKTLFLLHRRYAPYHKWLFRIADELSAWAHSIVSRICAGNTASERYPMAAEVCAEICRHMASLGLPRSPDPPSAFGIAYPEFPEIREYARGLTDAILDPKIRQLPRLQAVVFPSTMPTFAWIKEGDASA